MATYDEKDFTLQGHCEQSKERRRSDLSDKETHSTFILYDHSGRIIPPPPQRNGSTYSEQPRHQEDIEALKYRRWNSDHVTSRHCRLTPPPKYTSAIGPTSPDLQPGLRRLLPILRLKVIQPHQGPFPLYRIIYDIQNKMTRMHRELVEAVDRERNARGNLAEECKVLQQDLENLKIDFRNACRDSDRLMAENERLRQATRDQIGPRDEEHQQMEKQRVEAEQCVDWEGVSSV